MKGLDLIEAVKLKNRLKAAITDLETVVKHLESEIEEIMEQLQQMNENE